MNLARFAPTCRVNCKEIPLNVGLLETEPHFRSCYIYEILVVLYLIVSTVNSGIVKPANMITGFQTRVQC